MRRAALTSESQIDVYGLFAAALANATPTMAAPLVSPDFQAEFNPNQEFGICGLNYHGFIDEITRLRVAFPDFGRNIEMIEVIEAENVLRVTFDMTVKFTGLLTHPASRRLEPNGNTIVIRQTDTSTFTPDLLIEKFVVQNNIESVIE
jgi:hypothetical protein